MFWYIFSHELRSRYRMLSTWIYILIFFATAFLVANISGGAFDDIEMNAAKSGEFVFMNNPLNIAFAINIILYICTIVFAAIFGSSAVRDFEDHSYEISFTKPLSPRAYILGKFVGSYVSALSIAAATILGLAIGYQMPYLASFKVGPTMPMAYLHVFLYYTIPNLFLLGSVFFAAGLLSRKVINSYILGIGFFFSYILATVLMQNVEKVQIAAILDPFGMNSLSEIGRYWTAAQSNANYIPFSGLLLWNRLLWVAIGVSVILYTMSRFDFTTGRSKKPRKQIASVAPPVTELNFFTKVRPQPYQSWKQFFPLCWQGFKDIVFNRTFLVISCFFAFFLGLMIVAGDSGVYGTKSQPITSMVIQLLEGNFLLFGLIISTFYAGDLLWREKSLNMMQLYDTTPHHSYVTYLSKLGAIVLMQLCLLVISMLVGIAYQLAAGEVRIDIGLYLTELFFVQFIGLLPLTLMIFFFANVAGNKYAGYLAIILFYVAMIALPIFNIDHPLLVFNSGYAFYSELNGYGAWIPIFIVHKVYWLLFSLVLNFIGFKFWNRGMDHSYRSRIKLIRKSGYDKTWKLTTLALAAFLLLGGFLFYNMNILNEYTSPKSQIKLQESYEKDFKTRLTALPQPSISEVHYEVDIFPAKRKADLAGFYWLVNRTAVPIDTLVISYDSDYDVPKLGFSQPASLAQNYKDYGLCLYSLPQALAPQDSMRMDISLQHAPKGINSSGTGSDVMYNGTFINSGVFPSFGYQTGWELSDNNQRKKKGLPPKPRMYAISDSTQYKHSYVNANSDYVRYSAEISTEEGQLAFAPGDLLKSWTKAGRYHASFGSTVPVLNFFAFVSGKYEKAAAQYQDKQVEIYYDKKHAFNIASMLESATKSLKYYDENFMPYPHKALRIVEVPYVNFAQSFPALIPFSENVGFIAKIDPKSETTVDYPYQIVAHEISHQWWAHTVIGANVQGCTLFSECFAEYSSLMILKQKYGEERLRRQLNYETDQYLRGRSGEYKGEQPLYLVENQGYLNYNKGVLVMHALQGYIGEPAVNKALGAFCRDYAYHGNPFPISTDLLPYLKNALPDPLKYLVTDFFETITLYDNKIIQSTRSYDAKSKEYTTTITFSMDKARYDALGKKEPIPVADLVDIALYDDKEAKRLALDTISVTGGKQSISLKSKDKPGKVILDPYFKMIDTDRKNNIKSAG